VYVGVHFSQLIQLMERYYMIKVAVIAPQYLNDIRIFKEINTLKKKYPIHIFLTSTRKTSPKKEFFDDVTVYRFSHRSFENKFLQYPFSLIRYLRITRATRTLSPDICHVHDFPFLISGILVKLFTGCRLVYDAHEDFASMVYQNNTTMISLLRTAELFLVKLFVDRVITVNGSLKSYFLKTNVKTHVLMNVPLLNIQEIKNNGKEQEKIKNKEKDESKYFTLGYVGHIIWGRGYKTLIPLCESLVQSGIPVKILIVGGGPFKESFEKMIADHELQEYFVLTGEVLHDTIPSYLKKIDVGLLLFRPVRYNNIIATPNKLFEYMAFGIPIVASDLPEIRKIIKETGTGILVDPSKVKEIADNIIYLADNPEVVEEMRKNGKKAFQTTYNWDAQSSELLRVYAELINQGKVVSCVE
jgi:glycosyltransferase involved in cell wall biosynthesis